MLLFFYIISCPINKCVPSSSWGRDCNLVFNYPHLAVAEMRLLCMWGVTFEARGTIDQAYVILSEFRINYCWRTRIICEILKYILIIKYLSSLGNKHSVWANLVKDFYKHIIINIEWSIYMLNFDTLKFSFKCFS